MRLLPPELRPSETTHEALAELPGIDSLGQPRAPVKN